MSSKTNKKVIYPVYGIFGDENYLRNRRIQEIISKYITEDEATFNHDKFDAQECDAAQAVSTAYSVPMMAEYRVVEIKNIDALPAKKLEEYLKYIESPSDTTCVIFSGTATDKKKKFFKILDKKYTLENYSKGNKKTLTAHISRELKRMGCKFQSDVPSMICELLGAQDTALALEKLVLYKGKNEIITPDDVWNTIGTSIEAAIFQFIDDVFFERKEQAFLQLKLMTDSGQKLFSVISLLSRQLRMLIYLKTSGELPPKSPPFLKNKLHPLTKTFSYKKLYYWHKKIYETDKLMKSSKLDEKIILDRLLLNLFVNQGKN